MNKNTLLLGLAALFSAGCSSSEPASEPATTPSPSATAPAPTDPSAPSVQRSGGSTPTLNPGANTDNFGSKSGG